MTRWRILGLLPAIAFCGGSGALANAQVEVEEEWSEELIHSDLPIYTFNYEELWPRGMEPGPDSIAGCESRVAFGDWKFSPNPANESADEWWLRVRNYGVFHCAANLYLADVREELESGELSRGLFVRIGEEDSDNPERELWVLQQGFVPGSDYMLLARKADEDIVTRFTVLQRRCPIGATRSMMGMAVWTTSYCAINSDEDLYRLANGMLKLPALGELVLQKDPEAEEAAGSD
jgi:hypothetical protein